MNYRKIENISKNLFWELMLLGGGVNLTQTTWETGKIVLGWAFIVTALVLIVGTLVPVLNTKRRPN